MAKIRMLFAAILVSLFTAAVSQAYPTRPITVVVPLTAGSPVDVVARIVAQYLTSSLGQPVIVENRPGAGGTIAAKAVAIAEPDGHTLVLNAVNQVIAPAMYPNLSYHPIKDFAVVGGVALSPYVFVVAPSVPAKTLQELVDYAKANPGKLNFGYGLGTSPHILGELFKATAKVDLANIPYKGGAQAVNDILAGQIHLNIGTPSTLVPLIQAGKLRALAVTSDTRYPDLPDVPTVVESGFPQLSLTLWMGMLAPVGTPADVVKTLNGALNDALQSARMKESLAKLGFQGIPGSPQDFEKFLYSEMDGWGRAVKQTGVKMD